MPKKFRHFVHLDRMYSTADPSAMRWYVEALLLAGAGDDEIAGQVGLPPWFVGLYHDVFYDVRRYRGFKVAMLSAAMRRLDSFAEYDACWKRIGLECGVEALLAYWRGNESPAVSELLDRWLVNSMQRAAVKASEQPMRHIHPYDQGEVSDQYALQSIRD